MGEKKTRSAPASSSNLRLLHHHNRVSPVGLLHAACLVAQHVSSSSYPLQWEAEAQYVYKCTWMHVIGDAFHINLKLLEPVYLKLNSCLLH